MSAGEGRRLAAGSLAQQASQVTGLLTMLAIIAVLARELSLAELGVYGLLTSLLGYLLIVQNAGASAVVRTLAVSRGTVEARHAGFSTAVVLYAGAGALTAALLAGAGLALDPLLGLEGDLARQVWLGSALLGAVTLAGWPLTVYRDVLRAEGRFVRAAVTEMAALAVYAVLVLGLALGGADLALVLGASGAIPLLVGLGCLLSARSYGYRFRRGGLSTAGAREMLGLAGYVSLTEVAAAGIYAVDRLILGAFSSAATVALFEGPVRGHNLVRSLNSAVTVTVLPTAARYSEEGDARRLRELLVRGLRYTLALIVPLVVVGMVLAEPILEVWLGDGFGEGATAMTILMAHWLLNGCSGVLGAVLVGTGRARELAGYAALVAVANVALALSLAPGLGLEGVAIATTVPYALAFPLLLRRTLAAAPVAFGELVARAFVPALSAGAVLAAALLSVDSVVSPDSVLSVGALAGCAVAAYWSAFYLLIFDPAERGLVRDLVRRP